MTSEILSIEEAVPGKIIHCVVEGVNPNSIICSITHNVCAFSEVWLYRLKVSSVICTCLNFLLSVILLPCTRRERRLNVEFSLSTLIPSACFWPERRASWTLNILWLWTTSILINVCYLIGIWWTSYGLLWLHYQIGWEVCLYLLL